MTKQFLQSPPSNTHKLGEFELIRDIFKTRAEQMMKAKPQHAPLLGIGDDGAVIASRPNEELVITTDMLVADRHFFADADPYLVGKKSLAVNLSDLAAMGAKPTGFTLALALPKQRQAWLHGFANGLFDLAELFDCHLIGGDTCQGPLTISITAFGVIPSGQAIKRSGAQVGDSIWVSGELGDARLDIAY
ncbi:MAG: thiamine-phosphate kinase [Burkholderiaceae bacterium]|nr:thiamine-phosphate kinase [Burkholderiaceae bacterium]